jgi:hypothetical protein
MRLEFREAYGVRPARWRFRAVLAFDSGSKLLALHTLRAAWSPGGGGRERRTRPLLEDRVTILELACQIWHEYF